MPNRHLQHRTVSPRWARAGFLVCLFVSAAGCAKGVKPLSAAAAKSDPKGAAIPELERQLAARDARIDQLENRLALLEAEQRELRFAVAEREQVGIRETVRIGRSDEMESLDESEERAPAPRRREEARPVLRLIGERKAEPSGGAMPSVPLVTERLPVAPVPGLDAVAKSHDPGQLYQQAVDLLRQRAFAEALGRFTDFLARFPQDALAPRAMYWRGEILFAQRDYGRALAAFEGSLARDPAGDKAPDAMLKAGMCHKRLGSVERGRAVIERLKAQFPQSEAARLAAQEDA